MTSVELPGASPLIDGRIPDEADFVDVVIVQKDLMHDTPTEVSRADLVTSNLNHVGLLFRFHRHGYFRNVLVELQAVDFGTELLMPSMGDPASIRCLGDVAQRVRRGARLYIRYFANVHVHSTLFTKRYSHTHYVTRLSMPEMQSVWRKIRSYTAEHGTHYAFFGVYVRPKLSDEGLLDVDSLRQRLAHPVLEDHTCCAFVNRILGTCMSASDVPGVFMPRRDYLSWFVDSPASVVRMGEDDLGVVLRFYQSTRITKFTSLADLIQRLRAAATRLRYVIVPQWDVSAPGELAFYKVTPIDPLPSIHYQPYVLPAKRSKRHTGGRIVNGYEVPYA